MSNETELALDRPAAVLIRFPVGKKGVKEGEMVVPGWSVPGTDGLVGVDLRNEGSCQFMTENEWRITHLPSGFAMRRPPYTDASCLDDACDVALRLFGEMKELGCDMRATDPAQVTAALKGLTPDQLREMWKRVAGRKIDDE